jgi:glutamate/aspartate transport system substrate-binding protein
MKKQVLALAVMALAAGGAMAQATDTLAKIKSSGSVTMGVRDSSGALAYTIGDGKYVGFHTEMSRKILSDIQKQLGLPKLEVKEQLVTSQNRIPLVQNGTVDLECGSTTNNATRQKDVAFAITTRLCARTSAPRASTSRKSWARTTPTASCCSNRAVPMPS